MDATRRASVRHLGRCGTLDRMPSGAQVIVDSLEAAGVEVCFGLPGVHNLALWEALRRSPIRLVGVRHEQAAAYAADGFARATGRLGVALVTTGPGAANTAGAVGEAWASRSPVLVVATDIPTTLRRPGTYRGALHETTDQSALFAPITVARHRVSSVPLILSGGLTPENVGEAIGQVGPWGVDVASGTEREPGVKDPGKVEAFITAVRATAEEPSPESAVQEAAR